ncbi:MULTISPECIES: benzoate/H(+) symporter BenE family transporter [unclassified Oceanobacter]|uniref:benzoate/H(+) symporter BenE family transporter n=1 Tax=unclassified Oceanobacter TaxID=2620260 RepID=UPI0026E2EAE6|nr:MULTISPECIES: benzoate/H(+) symporter BenE family transporter [unclassified Oceanobacter]MDO6682675.1 benzoate/H(+) symporter BenE family transporter [Oceanobacter sp. 5_MG-2023]MDP2549343.1 benzoate/H(+) symporter BenE family transporter [Oceanobacter sp. 4_MG-2023]MDP2609114.1 benzoate/H(+) symporter BenE family transporter [Oceanobacter sp. 1_MG-2023]MDP2612436.1 benzoate/H(+) symporter BenE family transporter [Oceanobacter sp. 2_MG-2023]
MIKDVSASALIAGFMVVLVSFSGPLAIVFQAAEQAGVSHAMMTSWVWALSFGAGITGICLSAWLRVPVITAWSSPGAVLLVTLFPELSLNEAIGAYITAAVILLLIGISGLFDRVVHLIPRGVASAMMAGILFDFGLGAFRTLESTPVVAVVMVLAFVMFKFFSRSYFLVLLVVLGFGLSFTVLDADLSSLRWEMATPTLIMPEWTISSTLSLALPLMIVSLTGQFLPGFTILKSAGYTVSTRPVITVLSLTSIPIALFGGITTVVAAITASMCTSADAHPESDKRYIAGIASGFFYLLAGLFAGSVVLFFTSFPTEMIAIIAGLALLGAISGSLAGMLDDKEHLEASMVAFMTTASGISIYGIGSAFWGVVLGTAVFVMTNQLRRVAR